MTTDAFKWPRKERATTRWKCVERKRNAVAKSACVLDSKSSMLNNKRRTSGKKRNEKKDAKTRRRDATND